MCERKSERKYKYALDGACVSLIVEKEKDHFVYESVCVWVFVYVFCKICDSKRVKVKHKHMVVCGCEKKKVKM